MLKRLIHPYGVDINCTDNLGFTPLHVACKCGGVGTYPLASIKYLLRNGADVNRSMHQGSTPLHSACKSIDLSAISQLLEYGADVNSVDGHGCTPVL